MKNRRMMKVARTPGPASAVNRISGQCVLIVPARLNIWNKGTIVTSLGTGRPASTTRNRAFAPGKRIRAKAYPARLETSSVIRVTRTAM